MKIDKKQVTRTSYISMLVKSLKGIQEISDKSYYNKVQYSKIIFERKTEIEKFQKMSDKEFFDYASNFHPAWFLHNKLVYTDFEIEEPHNEGLEYDDLKLGSED